MSMYSFEISNLTLRVLRMACTPLSVLAALFQPFLRISSLLLGLIKLASLRALNIKPSIVLILLSFKLSKFL